jgi:hypothetical protein
MGVDTGSMVEPIERGELGVVGGLLDISEGSWLGRSAVCGALFVIFERACKSEV